MRIVIWRHNDRVRVLGPVAAHLSMGRGVRTCTIIVSERVKIGHGENLLNYSAANCRRRRLVVIGIGFPTTEALWRSHPWLNIPWHTHTQSHSRTHTSQDVIVKIWWKNPSKRNNSLISYNFLNPRRSSRNNTNSVFNWSIYQSDDGWNIYIGMMVRR